MQGSGQNWLFNIPKRVLDFNIFFLNTSFEVLWNATYYFCSRFTKTLLIWNALSLAFFGKNQSLGNWLYLTKYNFLCWRRDQSQNITINIILIMKLGIENHLNFIKLQLNCIHSQNSRQTCLLQSCIWSGHVHQWCCFCSFKSNYRKRFF